MEPSSAFLKEFEEAFQKEAASVETAAPSVPASRGPLHELAAVMASFDPNALRPTGTTDEAGEATTLFADSQPITGIGGGASKVWALTPDVRVEELRQLRERGAVNVALERARKIGSKDRMQRLLEGYLLGAPVPLSAQNLDQLGFTFQASRWLRDAGFPSVPDAASINIRAQWLTLLEPFEHLASDTAFRGREMELARLRDYAGVQPPESKLGALGRAVVEGLLGAKRPPLVIHGPGGVGKSALLARFILEHARAHEQSRFPFVYLDFDRPDVAANEPLSMLVEGVRQLGIEYPEAAPKCDRLRVEWAERLASTSSADRIAQSNFSSVSRPYGNVRRGIVEDFCNLIGTLGASELPVLLVLDTFEQVQRRSEEYVIDTWNLLEALREAAPRLRVVVAGRAPVEGFPTEDFPLAAFDEKAAVGFLTSRGIADERNARKIFGFVGGTPLALNLALALARRNPKGYLEDLRSSTSAFPFFTLDQERLQRQLYGRFLGNLKGDLQKLAHPGLVLRILTPQIVYEVLRKPCQLAIRSEDEARQLLEKLRAEVSLVHEGPDGSLRHRQDLRLEMIRLLQSDKPAQVKEIRTAAVEFYHNRDDPQSRAEEIYHRLFLGQDLRELDSRWVPGTDRYLSDALPELTGRAKAYLANRLGLEVDNATRAQADLEDWEHLVERRAREALSQGRYAHALEQLNERPQYSNLSPLYVPKAEALARLGRAKEALAVLDEGAQKAIEQAAWQHARLLTITASDIVLRSLQTLDSKPVLSRVEAMLKVPGTPAQQLENAMRVFALAGGAGVQRKIRGFFDAISDDELRNLPQLGCWFVAFAGVRDLKRIVRAIRLCNFPVTDHRSLRQLAVELASVDSRAKRALSRELGLPKTSGSLTAAWTTFLLSAEQTIVTNAIAWVLESEALTSPERLIGAVRFAMQSALGLRQHRERIPAASRAENQYAAKSTETGPTKALRAESEAALVDSLAAAFPTVDSLRDFARTRLELSIDSISTHFSVREIAADLVSFAQRSGSLGKLVTSARESRPNLASFAGIANELGLAVLVPTPKMIETMRQFAHPFSFEWLSAVEGQVCRVEREGDPIGTAFLVGVDLVLTALPVIEDLRSGKQHPEDYAFRFDYKPATKSAPLVNPGVVFTLDEQWLVASGGHSAGLEGTGFALLRLLGSPAVQPIGGPNAEVNARLRNWISLTGSPVPVRVGDPLVLVHHPAGGPLRVSFSEHGIRDSGEKDGHMQYDLSTQPGSSGAPGFTLDGSLIVLHLGNRSGRGRTGWRFGISIRRINEELEASSLGYVREARLV